MTDTVDTIRREFGYGLASIDAIERVEALGYPPKEAESLVDGWSALKPVVQDRAYWLSIYPDGNFPLGVLDD